MRSVNKHLFDVVIGNNKALNLLLAEVKKIKNELELQTSRILEEETERNLNELFGLDVLPQMEVRSDDRNLMCHKWGYPVPVPEMV
jgi:hypothetical protein